MATLKANNPLYVEKCVTARFAYCENRHVLKNIGYGWKRYAKVKKELTVEQAIEQRKKDCEELRIASPARQALLEWLESNVPLKNRHRLIEAYRNFKNDPDAILASLTEFDYSHEWSFSIRDIQHVCNLLEAWQKESRAIKESVKA